MKEIKILIVDDEQSARKKIRSYLKEEKYLTSIFEAKNGVEAVKMIQEKNPDIMFLDIQMPGMNGFEVIDSIGVEKMPAVVFVTAFDQYAIDAFEVHAVDYLLKPYNKDRFKKSFHRALEKNQMDQKDTTKIIKLLKRMHKQDTCLQRVMVKKGSRFFFVKTQEIMYISADEKYIKIHTVDGYHLIRDTMKWMEEHLDPSKFVRIHRFFIVNIDYIKEIQPWSHGDCIVILKNGAKLTMSRRFRNRLLGKV